MNRSLFLIVLEFELSHYRLHISDNNHLILIQFLISPTELVLIELKRLRPQSLHEPSLKYWGSLRKKLSLISIIMMVVLVVMKILEVIIQRCIEYV